MAEINEFTDALTLEESSKVLSQQLNCPISVERLLQFALNGDVVITLNSPYLFYAIDYLSYIELMSEEDSIPDEHENIIELTGKFPLYVNKMRSNLIEAEIDKISADESLPHVSEIRIIADNNECIILEKDSVLTAATGLPKRSSLVILIEDLNKCSENLLKKSKEKILEKPINDSEKERLLKVIALLSELLVQKTGNKFKSGESISAEGISKTIADHIQSTNLSNTYGLSEGSIAKRISKGVKLLAGDRPEKPK